MNRTKPRCGTVLICVLACLGIVMALVLSTIQSSLRGRHEVRLQRQLLQTELLCEAGVQRAIQQYNIAKEYVGETWRPKLGILSFQYVAVEIRIKPTSSGVGQIQAEIVASLASSEDSNDRMQRSHTFTIQTLDSAEKDAPKP